MDKRNLQQTYQRANKLKHTSDNSFLKSFASLLYQKKFALLFLFFMFVILGALSLKLYKPSQKQPLTIQKTIMKQTLVKRSIDLGIINRGLTGKAVDVNTGKIIAAARIFAPTDKTVYLELDFNSAPKGTVIDYIRYKKGRYVDHGEITLPKDNTKSTLFNWTINSLFVNTREGQWRVATYANGILAKRIVYEIKNNKLSYVYPDKPVRPTDPDYRLSNALALQSKTQ